MSEIVVLSVNYAVKILPRRTGLSSTWNSIYIHSFQLHVAQVHELFTLEVILQLQLNTQYPESL